MSKELKLRTLFGLTLALVVIISILVDVWVFSCLITLFSILAMDEWDKIIHFNKAGLISKIRSYLIIPIIAVLTIYSYYNFIFIFIIFSLIISVLVANKLKINYFWLITGVIYIYIPLISLIWIKSNIEGANIILIWLFFIIWGSDVGGYLFGKIIKGPKLVPKISPSKTWSGAIGALLFSILIAFTFASILPNSSLLLVLMVSIFISFCSQAGDLIESLFKRRHHIKDSGKLIPGHGGVLDRTDSLVLSAPLTVIIILFNSGSFLL
ncbi:phosphatidate cytidylyltransferase [Alphaproteobacteria bacterium]|nr:phosphatidate cytidylyltransferase [Alphaproteobacteria bacterium]